MGQIGMGAEAAAEDPQPGLQDLLANYMKS